MMPLGMEVDLGPGHIVLDGDPASPRKVHISPLLFAHVYCGHGRPSQLLQSCCCVRFIFFIPSQEIGLGERLRNDLFCVEWNVKP